MKAEAGNRGKSPGMNVARGEQNAGSDVDLIADFDTEKRVTLSTVVGLETRLSQMLDARVDLASASALRDSVRGRAERDAVVAF